MNKTIAQGAEALLTQTSETILLKDRVKKSYRLPTLDTKIRKQRTKREVKILEKASTLIPVPKLLSSSQNKIEMEFIPGKKLSSHLSSLPNSQAIEICKIIGKQIAILHDSGIVHGDLTTSNMILSPNNKLYFIDFGLSFFSIKAEDKAVDLHLIKQALEAKHFENSSLFSKTIISAYSSQSKEAPQILKRLEKVEMRGRYKQQF